MDRLNIFEALSMANGEGDSLEDAIDRVLDSQAFDDEREEGVNSGDDLTSDDEPDINTLRNRRPCRILQDEPENRVYSSDHFDSSDSEDDFPFLREQVERLRQGESPQQAGSSTLTDQPTVEDDVYVAKDGTKWNSVPPMSVGRTSSENVFRPPPTQVPGCDEIRTPLDAFSLFFSKEQIELLVKYTNLEGVRTKGTNFKKTDEIELKGFVGCLLFLGAMKQSMLPTTVVFDPFYGQNLVRATFSRNRFLELLACLRFDDKQTRNARRCHDVFTPFRVFWDVFTQNLKKYYIPGPCITIDEQIVPFRGRCSFLQYLPSKPDRYGLKIFWACDAENNYPLSAVPYLGRPLGAQRQVNLGRNMAIQLSTPYYKTGRNVTADNFFTDKQLSDTLLQNKLTFVGTVRGNRTFLPEPFKQKAGQELHSSTFVFNEKTTLVNYQTKAKKNVVVLSTMHHDKAVDPTAIKKKPDIIRFYNATKGAVDAMDKMAHAYSTKRVTKRWPMVMFYNTLDLGTIAARIIWQKKFPDDKLSHPDMRLQFLVKMAEQLCMERIQTRLSATNLSRPLRQTLTFVADHLSKKSVSEHQPRKGTSCSGKRKTATCSDKRGPPEKAAKQGTKKQGRCGSCHWKSDRKTTMFCFHCSAWLCKEHVKHICQDCTALASTSTVVTIAE